MNTIMLIIIAILVIIDIRETIKQAKLTHQSILLLYKTNENMYEGFNSSLKNIRNDIDIITCKIEEK